MKTLADQIREMQEVLPKMRRIKGGFFVLPRGPKPCWHPEHGFPTHIHIPVGMGYTHVCPECQMETTVTNSGGL